MEKRADRRSVDLSQYPNLVVAYFGMRVNTWMGIKTLLGFGPKIQGVVDQRPDGLLAYENLLLSLRHAAFRQYWRDFESMEAWARTMPHRQWWQGYVRDSGGTGFWHEVYFMRGGMEAIYDDMAVRVGFSKFAPVVQARGSMYSSRKRLHLGGEEAAGTPVSEEQIYAGSR